MAKYSCDYIHVRVLSTAVIAELTLNAAIVHLRIVAILNVQKQSDSFARYMLRFL